MNTETVADAILNSYKIFQCLVSRSQNTCRTGIRGDFQFFLISIWIKILFERPIQIFHYYKSTTEIEANWNLHRKTEKKKKDVETLVRIVATATISVVNF